MRLAIVALALICAIGCTSTEMPQTNHQPLVLTFTITGPGPDGEPGGAWQDVYVSLNGSESRQDARTDVEAKAKAAAAVNSPNAGVGVGSDDVEPEEDDVVEEVVEEVVPAAVGPVGVEEDVE